MNRYVMVDVETDGPVPGLYSMIQVGAVIVEPGLSRTFRADLAPIGPHFLPSTLSVTKLTREETLGFPSAMRAMENFHYWLLDNDFECGSKERFSKKSPIFISDNNGFDFAFVSYYFWFYRESCPFGHSSRNLGDLYKGIMKTTKVNFKHLRRTKHTHDPLDDAMGNAEALLTIIERHGLVGIID